MKKFFQKAEPIKKRRTRTYIATTEGKVFPFAMLNRAVIQKDSNQLAEATTWKSEKVATRPFDFSLFYWLYDNNVYMKRSVDQVASDIAGTGYTIAVKEGKSESSQEFDKISALLDKPNWEYSIEDLWQRFLIDLNITGNAPMEIVRNVGGEISELWHANVNRIWPHKSKRSGLFLEKSETDPNAKVYYVRFGKMDENDKPVHVDKTTGEEKEVEFKNRAHEMIYQTLYYPQSGYYGAPPVLPVAGDVVLGVSARDYNISFFINFGVPACLIHLSGEWDEDTEPDEEALVDGIKRQLKEIKGAENAHGSIILQTPEGCEMKVEKLDGQVKEASFTGCRRIGSDSRRQGASQGMSLMKC
jgi:capsid portal protein